jgi:hypothetical protein
VKTFDIRDPAEAEQTQEEADWAWYAHFFPETVADLWECSDEESCARLAEIFFGGESK